MLKFMEKMKSDSKKDKLKELIKMLGERMLDDSDADMDDEEEKIMDKSGKSKMSGMELEVRSKPLREKSEEGLLEDMEDHEIGEKMERAKADDKDDDMLEEMHRFMRKDKEAPEYLKDKRSRRMMDPTDVPQSTQKIFKAIPDDFDVKMAKKKKMKMKMNMR